MNIQDKVFEILKERSGQEEIRETDRLQEDLALDSLAMVSLLLDIEDAFDIQLDEADMNPFDLLTAADVTELAQKYGGDDHGEED